LALGYGSKRRSKKKRKNANCAKDTMTVTGSKWAKEQKIWSEVRETKAWDVEVEDDRLERKMDHGKLSKWKKLPLDALEHRPRRKER
jgi:hypothetical protein